MKTPIHTIDEYRDMSTEVWTIFKKYYPDDANLIEFDEDMRALTKKYSKNVRKYSFILPLMRVYFHELVELKQLQGIKITWEL